MYDELDRFYLWQVLSLLSIIPLSGSQQVRINSHLLIHRDCFICYLTPISHSPGPRYSRWPPLTSVASLWRQRSGITIYRKYSFITFKIRKLLRFYPYLTFTGQDIHLPCPSHSPYLTFRNFLVVGNGLMVDQPITDPISGFSGPELDKKKGKTFHVTGSSHAEPKQVTGL